jgi:hypothetical protein
MLRPYQRVLPPLRAYLGACGKINNNFRECCGFVTPSWFLKWLARFRFVARRSQFALECQSTKLSGAVLAASKQPYRNRPYLELSSQGQWGRRICEAWSAGRPRRSPPTRCECSSQSTTSRKNPGLRISASRSAYVPSHSTLRLPQCPCR